MWSASSAFSELVQENEWETIGKVLSTELHELISKWGNLSIKERGELSGHTIGKMGTDLVLPAASVKVLVAGFKGAKEFSIACKTLKNAEKTLALEAFAQSTEKLEVLTSSVNRLENVIIHTDKLAEAGKVMDRGGLTRAGRGLMKHGYREDSFFSKTHWKCNSNKCSWPINARINFKSSRKTNNYRFKKKIRPNNGY